MLKSPHRFIYVVFHVFNIFLLSVHSPQCSVDCGVGRRTRSVRCVSEQGGVVSDNECNSRLRPQGSEECNMGPCVTNWYFTDWSNTVSNTHTQKGTSSSCDPQHDLPLPQCSAQCGPGVQKREVVCLTRGGVRDGGGGGDCVADKPMEMKACNRGLCVPTFLWYSSSWSQVRRREENVFLY